MTPEQSPSPKTAAPRAEEAWFPLNEAANLAAVEERFGAFTPAQRAFLEEHRFLLVPRRAPRWRGRADEMLNVFDAITTRVVEYPWGKTPPEAPPDPAGARLYNPDIFQHALHMYFCRRMRSLEEGDLAPTLRKLLSALAEEALKPGGASDEKLVAAELLTAFLLLEPALAGDDSLKGSLAALAPWRARLGEKPAAAVAAELRRIHAANMTARCSFRGWASPYKANVVGDAETGYKLDFIELDYTAFKPRGYYVNSAALRGWFRAMIWLGQTGFDLQNDRGLAAAAAFAGLLIRVPQAREELARIMRVTALFHGLPDMATPEDWLSFLERTLGREPDAKTADDPAALARIRVALPNLRAGNSAFAGIREDQPTRILSLFPARFSLPWLIADELTWKENAVKGDLPRRFSALWIPALFGNANARQALPMQLRKTLASCHDVDARLEPRPCPPIEEDSASARTALEREMARLAERLGKVTPADWSGSLATGRMRLLTTLNARFGAGYPLYMQDALFGAKQLESQLGAYTELKYDTVLYEKPNYPPPPSGLPPEYVGTLPPLSFVEPNLLFWEELQSQVRLIEQFFRENRLFSWDLKQNGALTVFREAVDLCAAVAAKELAGQRPDDDEIDRLHKLNLARVAAPVDGQEIEKDEEWWSGLMVDAQTVPDAPGQGVVYEALGIPHYMFALVGSGANKRIVTGLAYNHFEFIGPFGPGIQRFNDLDWKHRAYAPDASAKPLPQKNFWYAGLLL